MTGLSRATEPGRMTNLKWRTDPEKFEASAETINRRHHPNGNLLFEVASK
jgi:hypothetical protein